MAKTTESPVTAQTVELTSKRLKLQQVIAVLLIIVGGVWFWTTIETGSDSPTGALILVAGFVWWFVTRVRIWWHHK